MSNIEQMRENTSFMRDFKPLTPQELLVIDKARAALATIPSVPCTTCRYCVPGCPKNIPIPEIFDCLNREFVFGNATGAKFWYNFVTMNGIKASHCVNCGNCVKACPQKIDIPATLREAAAKYE